MVVLQWVTTAPCLAIQRQCRQQADWHRAIVTISRARDKRKAWRKAMTTVPGNGSLR
jgi:hypothetical protein